MKTKEEPRPRTQSVEPLFKSISIDTEKNALLCSPSLVGKGEIVEVYCLDQETPPQASGRILRKVGDPNSFVVCQSFDGHDALGRGYEVGPRCILRVLLRNLSGTRRRKFSADERMLVNMEKGEDFHERKVVRAKTGSVRQRGKKK
jgi:hypothetical protein